MKPNKKDALLPPARAVALECVNEILEHGQDLQGVLDARLRGVRISMPDAALCTELVYGYMRLKDRIGALLGRFLKDDSKLPNKCRIAMGLAAYEMLFLDRIPVYASVDWCVNYVKRQFSQGLGKLVNAVLRNLDRMGDEAHDMAVVTKGMPRARQLAVWYSCPEWIVEMWLDAYGEEQTLAYLTAGISSAPVGLRVNRAKPDADALVEELAGHSDCLKREGYSLLFPAGAAPVGMKSMLAEGQISRQSFASQEVLAVTEPQKWQGPVWDCCCGRGGKTIALLEASVPVRYASDTSRERLRGMREEMERLGMEPPFSLLRSATEPVAPEVWEEIGEVAFRTILADVPCSGLGTLSRRPDARYHRTPEGVRDLIATQAAILDNAFAHLMTGGRLIYITCTVNPDENERQIAAFLDRTEGVTLEREWHTPQDSPYMEFFYAAMLRRA
ncbi:Fmu (Sun) domain-containing protein [Desulfovibrio mangrovi]|uniref:RsmB/NOP family class I SAM-dependent RNA methyltransferase n=1 Tax=Desulfovibrio mangrovi TaxID=2976983 RepID=UPI002247F343|nr:transcription antitermination factor NusB [Desulfovibrio mangrovi]UZP66320.1 Fmu (Sun) domain-containing protein [Desulfovibrio mangrovi]